MSEFTPAPDAAGPSQPPLMVNHQYVKDLSFEVPGAPEIFSTLRSPPQVQINLDVQARRLQEGADVFEVTLAVRAEASDTSSGTARVVFIAELAYGGIFTLNGIPAESVEPVLLVECPRLLFPFARNIVADVTREGGFPRCSSSRSTSWRCGRAAGASAPRSDTPRRGQGHRRR